MAIDARSILRTKRDGGELSEQEIHFFITEYVDKKIGEYHASALLMAIFINGMQPRELERWTRAMLESGKRLSFPELEQVPSSTSTRPAAWATRSRFRSRRRWPLAAWRCR